MLIILSSAFNTIYFGMHCSVLITLPLHLMPVQILLISCDIVITHICKER